MSAPVSITSPLDATPRAASDARESMVDAEFRAFVDDPAFPCLAGRGVTRGDGFRLHVYGTLGAARTTPALARDLAAFVQAMPADGARLHSFVAVFPQRAPRDEAGFERALWRQLQRLHAHDAPDAPWDPSVSDDPEDPHFSFSFAGCALFVVGLYPDSSRLARRFRWPALVFNPHAQFEQLRADGRYARLQAVVREREIALQGTINPNLADFGDRSEARQYSGRPASPDWRCPFHREAP